MQSKRIVTGLGLALAMAGLLLSGCSGSASISVSKGPVTATGTIQFDHTCSTQGACKDQGGVFMKFATAVEHFFISEAMATTQVFDASTGRIDIATTNVSLTTTSGSGVVTLYSNGTAIASKTVSYYRSGNSLYVTNPGSVNTWESAYEGSYDSFSFTVNNLAYTPTTTAQVNAHITATMVYNGDTAATGTTSYPINSGGTGGCGIGVNCQQQ